MFLERAHQVMALLACSAIEQVEGIELALASEGCHFAEVHLVDQGLMLLGRLLLR